MAVAKVEFRRARAHVRYRLADNTIVPGTTTICGLLDKSGYLVPWANRLGLEGIDCNEYRDALAGVGTLAHSMMRTTLSGKPLDEDLDEYSPKEVRLADNAIIKLHAWMEAHVYEPFLVEEQLVSEEFRFGGMIDNWGALDNKLNLIDGKTGKRIYDDMVLQLAAYRQLLRESGRKVEEARILRIGRDETEDFEERVFTNSQLDAGWEIFLHLRAIYDLKKRIGG